MREGSPIYHEGHMEDDISLKGKVPETQFEAAEQSLTSEQREQSIQRLQSDIERLSLESADFQSMLSSGDTKASNGVDLAEDIKRHMQIREKLKGHLTKELQELEK